MKNYVSYYWSNGAQHGYADLYTPDPMATQEGIEGVRDWIKKEDGYTSVVFLCVKGVSS